MKKKMILMIMMFMAFMAMIGQASALIYSNCIVAMEDGIWFRNLRPSLDPVKISHSGSDKVWEGFASEGSFSFNVNVYWDNIPYQGKWVIVKMEEKSHFGIVFTPEIMNLTKTNYSRTVQLTVPVTGLDEGTYHIHIKANTIDQNPTNPHVAGSESQNLWFEIDKPPKQYSLTISVQSCNGSTSGFGITNPIPGCYWYLAGQIATVNAIPAQGWFFQNWILDGHSISNKTNPIIIEMCDPQEPCDNHNLVAIFNPIPIPPPIKYVYLTVIAQACNEAQEGFGNTDPIGTHCYVQGSIVPIIAYPVEGWFLQGWTLDTNDIGASQSIEVTMNCNHTVIATFNPIPPKMVCLTVYKFCSKPVTPYGDISPDVGTYCVEVGTTLTFTAYSNVYGFTFYSWNLDGQEIFGNTISVTVTQDSMLYAWFVPTTIWWNP